MPIAALIPLAISAVSAIVQMQQRKEYADTMSKQKLEMPSGIAEAEAIYKQLANVGLPGAEKIKENIFASAASNLSEARRTTGNMSDYLEILNRAYTGAEDKALGVDIQDAQAKASNMATLASFLGGTKANAETDINKFDIQKNLDMEREKMAGTNNIFATLESGVGSSMDAYAKNLYLENQNEILGELKKSWQTGGTPGSSVVDMGLTPPVNNGNPFSNMNPGANMNLGDSKMDAYYQVLKSMGILN